MICFLVIFQYRTEEDHFKKEEKKAKLLKETIPFYLNKFEQTVAENGGYAVGSTVKRNLSNDLAFTRVYLIKLKQTKLCAEEYKRSENKILFAILFDVLVVKIEIE